MKTPIVFWGSLLEVLNATVLDRINVREQEGWTAILAGADGQLDLAVSLLESLKVPYKTGKMDGDRKGRCIVFEGCRWDKKGRLVK